MEPDEPAFRRRIAAAAPGLEAGALDALAVHLQELHRWNRRLSLVGPGAGAEIIERHYLEALAALPLLGPAPGVGVDLGSGAGFPGWILAATAPRFGMVLTEPNGRKAAFLRAAAQRAGVELAVLDVRVDLPLPSALPQAIDLLTIRALRLAPRVAAALAERLAPGGRWLFWTPTATPIPPALRRVTELDLGGRERRLVVAAR